MDRQISTAKLENEFRGILDDADSKRIILSGVFVRDAMKMYGIITSDE